MFRLEYRASLRLLRVYVLIFIGRGAWSKRIEFDESVVRHLLEFIFPRNDISNSPYQLSNLEASTPLSRSSHRSIFSNCQFPITFHALFQSCSYRSILEKRGGDVTFYGRWQSSETDSKISFRQTTLDKLCNDLFNRLWTV